MKQFNLPDPGEGLLEAEIVNWLVKPGDMVKVNDVLVVQPSFYLSRFLVWFDAKGVDGFVNGSAAFVGGLSGRLRRYQTGFARSYALSMVGGAVLVVLALVLVRAS